MKKYTLILSFFVFLLFSSNFNIAKAATISTSECVFSSTLKLGSKGEEVTCLQKQLGVSADGYFGKKTKAAVVAWQKGVGLKADGVFGILSRNALVPVVTLSGDFPPGCDAKSEFSIMTGKPCAVSEKYPEVTITSPSILPNAKLNTSYTFNPEATGGAKNFSSNNYSWAVFDGALPPGLDLIEGIFINGIPRETGTYNFSLSASNGTQKATKKFSLTVDGEGNLTGAN
ncbi:MAG: putative Ig domain-containing protein [Candidatus Paceibacterota bacterium]|jgi:peptidoglycan hydrolase-like protein with peptidoglycan-binding domain